jgi:hypothetical protein
MADQYQYQPRPRTYRFYRDFTEDDPRWKNVGKGERGYGWKVGNAAFMDMYPDHRFDPFWPDGNCPPLVRLLRERGRENYRRLIQAIGGEEHHPFSWIQTRAKILAPRGTNGKREKGAWKAAIKQASAEYKNSDHYREFKRRLEAYKQRRHPKN